MVIQPRTPNLRIGYHLGNAFQLYREQPLLYITASLPASVALILGNRWANSMANTTIDAWSKDVASFPNGWEHLIPALNVLSFAGLVSFWLAHLALPLVVNARGTGIATIEQSVLALPKLLPVCGFILIASTLALGAFLIPGIYLFGAAAPAPFFLLRGKLSISKAITKSFHECGTYAFAVGAVLGTANLLSVLGLYVYNVGLFVTYPIYILTLASVGREFPEDPSYVV